MCALTAPEVFDQDDDGIVVTLTEQPGPEATDAVREAVQLCPAGALKLAGS
ncbi:ferredoxin [Prauserella flavalba]|uniref:Ferredoxin n=2 Tax=Prauserella flavalba TaxID=1477506 RepID=A0A318LJN4_9PSEU|nr:ferredoxin [Prauserella flavalba]